MLTYQVRKRVYKADVAFTFPNSVEVRILFQPLQPFGMAEGGGRTAVQAVGATLLFDANTGRYQVASKSPLKPLDIVIEEPNRRVEVQGHRLVIRWHCATRKELDDLIEGVYFGLPMLLNLEFADPPVVERVEGTVGSVTFRWELERWHSELLITTQEQQESKVATSWEGFNVISTSERRRLDAALHYFHVACRLGRVGHSPWEFMGEIILNLAKVLQVLFPPKGDGKDMDSARSALTRLGYPSEDIERSFIPALALRHQIDVAHVDLSLFTRQQLETLHHYTEAAESSFRQMLQRLMFAVNSGSFEVPPYGEPGTRAEAVRIIERLASALPAERRP